MSVEKGAVPAAEEAHTPDLLASEYQGCCPQHGRLHFGLLRHTNISTLHSYKWIIELVSEGAAAAQP